MHKSTLLSRIPLWPLYILLLTSTDTVLFGTNSNNTFLYIPRIIGAFLILFLLILYKRKKISFGIHEVSLLIMCFIVIISCLFNKADFGTLVSRIIAICTGYTIALKYRHKDFVYAFSKFMYFIATVAIITHVLAYLLPDLIKLMPIVVNTANNSFYNFLIGGIGANLSVFLIRSSSIFWEPGAFAVYLVIAIMFETFVSRSRTYFKKMIVFITCLVITFSTTGYIALAFLLIIYITNKNNPVKSSSLKIVSVVFLTSLCLILVLGEQTIIYEKLFAKVVNYESTSVTRYASLINGFEIAINNPWYGISPVNMRTFMAAYAQQSMFVFGANPMNVNTLSYQFAAFGIIFGMFFLIGTIKYMNKIGNSKTSRIALLIVLLLLYSGEAFYSFLPFIFVFYGFKSWEGGSQ